MRNNTYITEDERNSVKSAMWKATAILEVAAYAYNAAACNKDEPIHERADDICNAILDYVREADDVVEDIIARVNE